MARTTVYLPKDFVEAVKLEAISRKMTLTGMVYAGLKKKIATKPRPPKRLILSSYNLGLGAKR